METKKILNGRALFVQKDIIWVARGTTFFGISYDGKRITRKYTTGTAIEKLLSSFRLSRQFLRLGIHHLLPLHNGGFFITVKRKAFTIDKNGKVINTFSGYRGNKPGHRGVCITPNGTIFFGEYTVNLDNSHPTSLYRSVDNGLTFNEILTFKENEVRHIHFIQWDYYDECIWMGTGDKDYECKLMRSYDFGDTWETVGEGSQLWRAVGISITKEALYWGTDAGSVSDPNFIIKMNKKNLKIEKIQEIQGPCHGNAVIRNGTIYVSSGIEGGPNEKDNYAHLWECINAIEFKEIYQRRKDIFPLIIQYGVIRFPMGLENSDFAVFTDYALAGNGETTYII